MKIRKITDPVTGLTTEVTTNKRVRYWWWVSETGAMCVSVRYGNRVLELAKGKYSVELPTPDDLISRLEKIKSAVRCTLWKSNVIQQPREAK